MKRKKKIILVLILLFISIGFAVLTSNLGTTGAISFQDASFNVHFENANIEDTSIDDAITSINTGDISITTTATFEKPGDYIDTSFYVVNGGTMDALLNTLSVSGLTTELQNYFAYTLKYDIGGSSVAKGDVLRAGQGRKINLHLEYKFNVESLTTATNLNLTVSMNYINPKKVINDTVWNYEYTGKEQIFYVNKTGNYKIEAWGAAGTDYNNSNLNGKGAYAKGIIELNKNTKYYINVGGSSGYNGGGTHAIEGTNGGGATDIRTVSSNNNNFDSLKTRLIVAGAGGGLEYHSAYSKGGYAGGLYGGLATYRDNNTYTIQNSSGNQIQGGIALYSGFDKAYGNAGTFGIGGNGYSYGGGGGAGYFGGSGGINRPVSSERESSGGGGSSYISGHIGCVAIEGSSTENNITFPTKHGVLCTNGTVDIDCSIHSSGKFFTETVMIDGEGHEWKYHEGDAEVVASTEIIGMPIYNGNGTMTGNKGNGFVKITYLGNI